MPARRSSWWPSQSHSKEVAHSDEATKHPVGVEVSGKGVNTRPKRRPFLPVGTTGLIQVRRHLVPIEPQIVLLVRMTEEIEELVMRLKRPDRRVLKSVERNVRAAEI